MSAANSERANMNVVNMRSDAKQSGVSTEYEIIERSDISSTQYDNNSER
jgi:hypothetical protein